MFSGIVKGLVEVNDVEKKRGLTTFSVTAQKNIFSVIKTGASVSIDGVCLTASKIDRQKIFFDVMQETLDKTTLKYLEKNQLVNIERSIKAGDEIGGHIVSGHVHGEAEIVKVEEAENNKKNVFKCDKNLIKYIFPKGFIALDGVSLTVVDVDKKQGTFTVCLIPETLKLTTFGFKNMGDFVNLEIDQQTRTIVDTVEAVLGNLNK